VYLASNELLKNQIGRKAVVILSDGVDRGSKSTLESAIESAQRADTVVYCIYFAGQREEHGNRGDGGGMGRPGGGWPGGGGGWPLAAASPASPSRQTPATGPSSTAARPTTAGTAHSPAVSPIATLLALSREVDAINHRVGALGRLDRTLE